MISKGRFRPWRDFRRALVAAVLALGAAGSATAYGQGWHHGGGHAGGGAGGGPHAWGGGFGHGGGYPGGWRGAGESHWAGHVEAHRGWGGGDPRGHWQGWHGGGGPHVANGAWVAAHGVGGPWRGLGADPHGGGWVDSRPGYWNWRAAWGWRDPGFGWYGGWGWAAPLFTVGLIVAPPLIVVPPPLYIAPPPVVVGVPMIAPASRRRCAITDRHGRCARTIGDGGARSADRSGQSATHCRTAAARGRRRRCSATGDLRAAGLWAGDRAARPGLCRDRAVLVARRFHRWWFCCRGFRCACRPRLPCLWRLAQRSAWSCLGAAALGRTLGWPPYACRWTSRLGGTRQLGSCRLGS